MSKVLVLNASYEPLNITGWRRAAILMLKGKAESIEHNGKFLHRDFPLPTVIRLRHYVTVPYREIPLTRRNILNRDGHTCQYCGVKGDDLTLDHVMPRSRGGAASWENLTTACMRCNVKKGSRTPKEANQPLKNQPRRPHSSLHYEAINHVNNGSHVEWRKYIIGI